MENGWIKLHNKFLKWGWLDKPEMVSLFIYLLLSANYQDKEWHGTIIKRGQTVIGTTKLPKTLGFSRQTLRTCLERLKLTNEITIKSTNKFSVITIVKYSEYQQIPEKLTIKSTTKSTNNQPSSNHQVTTPIDIKNIRNKDININNIPETSSEVIPNLLNDNQKHIKIIGLYAKAKKIEFESKEQVSSFIKRNLRASKDLIPYKTEKIIEILKYLIDNADFKWTLESVGKYIDEDLTKINNKSKIEII